MQVLEASVGGTRHYLLDLAYNLPAEHFEQHAVVSTLRDPAFAEDIQRMRAAGVQVTEVPMRRNISPRSDWECYRQIRRIIGQWRPQVIHSHSSKAGFLARMAARSARCANLYTPHCFAFQMRVGQRKQWMYRTLERLAGRHTDWLVLPCESQRQIALEARVVPPEKIAIIATGVRPGDYQSEAEAYEVRERLGVAESCLALGTVAALTPQKGHGYLLDAFAEASRDTEAVLLLAGTGEEYAALVEQAEGLGIAGKVRFLGQRDDVGDVLRALDVFVLPSLWEGLPYGLLEAMAAGVPVVTTDIPGNADLIDGRTNGWLAAPASAGSLAAALREAMSDAAERARRASAAKQLVETHYTLDGMIAGYAELYARVGAPYRE